MAQAAKARKPGRPFGSKKRKDDGATPPSTPVKRTRSSAAAASNSGRADDNGGDEAVDDGDGDGDGDELDGTQQTTGGMSDFEVIGSTQQQTQPHVDLESGSKSTTGSEKTQITIADDDGPVAIEDAKKATGGVSVYIPVQYLDYCRAAESMDEYKGRLIHLMAFLFIAYRFVTPDVRREIVARTLPATLSYDPKVSIDCFDYISAQQENNVEFYKKKVITYGEWFRKTAAGECYAGYLLDMLSSEGDNFQYTAHFIRPTTDQLFAWLVDDTVHYGFEVNRFHCVDVFRTILPFLETLPVREGYDDHVNWIAGQKGEKLFRIMFSMFLDDIRCYVAFEGVAPGKLSLKQLTERFKHGYEISRDDWPVMKMPHECKGVVGHRRKRFLPYPFGHYGISFGDQPGINRYIPAAFDQLPVIKEGPIDQQHMLYGAGTLENPFRRFALGPALSKEVKPPRVINVDDDNTEPNENNDNDEDKDYDVFDLEGKPWDKLSDGTEFGRADPGIGQEVETNIDGMFRGIDANSDYGIEDIRDELDQVSDETALEMAISVMEDLEQQGIEYNTTEIISVMKSVMYTASAPYDHISELAKQWDQGTIFHKIGITNAACDYQIRVITSICLALSNHVTTQKEVLEDLKMKEDDLEVELKFWEKKVIEAQEIRKDILESRKRQQETKAAIERAKIEAAKGEAGINSPSVNSSEPRSIGGFGLFRNRKSAPTGGVSHASSMIRDKASAAKLLLDRNKRV